MMLGVVASNGSGVIVETVVSVVSEMIGVAVVVANECIGGGCPLDEGGVNNCCSNGGLGGVVDVVVAVGVRAIMAGGSSRVVAAAITIVITTAEKYRRER